MDALKQHLSNRVKLRQLQVVVMLEKYQSVGRASEYLGLVQPSITKSLRDLEELVGVTLFERTANGIFPTEYGKLFVKYAKSVLSEMRNASQELSSLVGGAGGIIIVGSQMPAEPLLPYALAQMRKRCPEVTVTVMEGADDQLIPSLSDGEIDLIVGRIPEPNTYAGLISEALFDEQIWMVARQGHPLIRKGGPISVKELFDYQWILPLQHMTVTTKLQALVKSHGFSLSRRQIETVSSSLVSSVLMETDMISPLPQHAVAEGIKASTLARIPTDLEIISGPIGITLNAGKQATSIMQMMIDSFRESAKMVH